MKAIALLARTAVSALAVFLLGLAFDSHALGLFGAAIGAAVLLVAAGDYAAPTRRWEPRSIRLAALASAGRAHERLPLAA